jgi:type II secretory pathway pseudopilin PulG
MPSLTAKIPAPRRTRLGFSLIEAVMVLLIIATVVGALTPSVIRTISHARVNRAASVVAADFFLAQSMAGRQHSPVVVTFDPTNKLTTIALTSGTTLVTRRFGTDSEFKLSSYSASPASVVVLPSAMASAQVTVTVSDGSYSRQVRMTRAGFVRVL